MSESIIQMVYSCVNAGKHIQKSENAEEKSGILLAMEEGTELRENDVKMGAPLINGLCMK